jgi:hypothetical protein
VAGLSACASDNTATAVRPICADADDGSASNAVVLMAQSVPSAGWVPCLRTTVPLGWTFRHLDARNGIARFWLDSEQADRAIEVRLEASCDTGGATEIPSDQEKMRRFERVTMTTPRFEGKRYYVFDGGCITYVFHLAGDNGENRAEPLALATETVGAVSRADLRAQVRAETDGMLQLDPPRGSG